jgi:S1-C subfamily serine protease
MRWTRWTMAHWTTALLTWALLASIGAATAQSLPRELRERIVQAVVEVNRFSASESRVVGAGSGTIVSADGYILTNFHVVGDVETGFADEWHAIATTDPAHPDRPPEHRYWARYIAGEPLYDLAIVQIVEDAEENPLPPGTTFPYLAVGDSNGVYPGDPVFVFGYPGISGSTITFTQGSISGFLGEDLAAGGKQWIKTDAKLARGNSGGTAVDEQGLLIGIPTLRFQTEDGGYIEAQDYLRPVALAWPLLEQYVANVADGRSEASAGLGSRVASAAPAPAAVRASPGALAPPPAGGIGEAATPTPVTPSPATPAAAVTEDGRLTFFESGVLTSTSPTLDGGEHVALFERPFASGRQVYVSATSDEFDVYLVVLDPLGDVIVEVDDSPGMGLDVAERFVAETSGTFVIGVTSYGPGETGAFELTVREDGAASDAVAPGATFSAAAIGSASGFVGSLPLGQLTRTTLAGSEGQTPWHTFRIDVPAGTARLTVDMTADLDLDLFLRHGEEVTNWGDDGDWDYRDVSLDTRASLVVESPAAGAWFVDVVWYGGESGEAHYSVRAR